MDINLALQQFNHLVNEFINHEDFSVEGNKIFKQKERQLVAFSQTFNALVVSLIALENSDEPNTVYFASQFVKDKLKFEFEQLSPEAVVQTHTRIINIIRSKTNINKIVTSNLALCLSFLYIHCYDKLGTALDFFKNTFSSGSVSAVTGNLYYQYLFRYLDGLACEVDSRKLVIDEMKRNQVVKTLKAQQMEIVLALHNIYSEVSKSTTIKLSIADYENLIYSFSEWIRIADPPVELEKEIHNHSIFRLAVESLAEPTLTDAATECVLNAIQVVRNPQENPGFYEFLGNSLPILLKKVNHKLEEEDYEQAENYVKVLSEYGMRAGQILIQKFNEVSLLFIQQMTKITENPIMQVFQQLVDFWQAMIHFITNRSASSPLTQELAVHLIGYLYQIFVGRIRYNPTQIHELDQLSERQLAKLHQSIEDVRDRREAAAYIFESIAKFLGHDLFLSEIISTIAGLDQSDPEYWGKVQSYIYSIRDVVKRIVQPTKQLCQLVLFFQKITDKHIMVRKTILRVYSALQSMQEKNQEFVLKVLVHITTMFDEPLLAQKTGETFAKCCEQNAELLVKHIQSLYALMSKYPNNDSILMGITHILKQYPSLLSAHLPEIIKGPLQRLKTSKSKKQKRNQFSKLFTIIECIPKGETKNISEIIELLLKEMWPIVSQIISEPEQAETDQDRLIERAVKFLKLVMRSIPEQFVKYLKDIFQVVLQAYKKYPINSYIYLYEVTFTVYHKSKQPQLATYLKTLYQQLCRITYLHLNSEDAIVNYQHLVDDFIGLNKRIVTFHTRMFFESGQVKPILEFSTHCLGSNLPRIASSASQMFEIIFMIYWNPYSRQQYKDEDKGEVVIVDPSNSAMYAQLKQFILPSIPNLLRNMFKFLETGPVESARNNILDCFEAIGLAFPKESKQLWTAPLGQLAEDIMTMSEKERLKENLLKLGSETHLEFINAEQIMSRLLTTISNRYLYRRSRAENLTNR